MDNEDWVNISENSIYTYKLLCDSCLSEIEIVQFGSKIDESLFPEILENIHKKIVLDSYSSYRYVPNKDIWIKVNIDIKNKKCIPI